MTDNEKAIYRKHLAELSPDALVAETTTILKQSRIIGGEPILHDGLMYTELCRQAMIAAGLGATFLALADLIRGGKIHDDLARCKRCGWKKGYHRDSDLRCPFIVQIGGRCNPGGAWFYLDTVFEATR